MTELFQDMLKTARRQNATLFGACPAEALAGAPKGLRPADLLPQAESLACFALPAPKGVFNAGKRSNWLYWRTANVYYRKLDMLALALCALAEGRGHMATPLFACFPYDLKGHGEFEGYLSLPRAAQACGLGGLGKNGLLFNPQYGPRLLLGGLVTSAELGQGAWPRASRQGCPQGCRLCLDACPAGAIDEHQNVDCAACLKESMYTPVFSFLMKNLEGAKERPSDINQLAGVDDHAAYRCTLCVAACPHPLDYEAASGHLNERFSHDGKDSA